MRNDCTRHTFTSVCILLKFCGDGSSCIASVVARQGLFAFLAKARLFTPGNAESFDSELAEMMNTKLEGSWSRESLRATMDTWQKLKATKATLPWNVS